MNIDSLNLIRIDIINDRLRDQEDDDGESSPRSGAENFVQGSESPATRSAAAAAAKGTKREMELENWIAKGLLVLLNFAA